MPWTRLDDQFIYSPKVRSVSTDARWLYIAGLVWSVGALTDGAISPESLVIFVGEYSPRKREKAVRELLNAGLWESNGDGWLIHDYAVYQPTRASIEAERAANRERQQRYRDKRVSNALLTDRDKRVSNRTPSQPDPSQPIISSKETMMLANEWAEQTGIAPTTAWRQNYGPYFVEVLEIAGGQYPTGFVKWAKTEGCYSPAGLPKFYPRWLQTRPRPVVECVTCDNRTWIYPDGVAEPCPDCRASWKGNNQ